MALEPVVRAVVPAVVPAEDPEAAPAVVLAVVRAAVPVEDLVVALGVAPVEVPGVARVVTPVAAPGEARGGRVPAVAPAPAARGAMAIGEAARLSLIDAVVAPMRRDRRPGAEWPGVGLDAWNARSRKIDRSVARRPPSGRRDPGAPSRNARIAFVTRPPRRWPVVRPGVARGRVRGRWNAWPCRRPHGDFPMLTCC